MPIYICQWFRVFELGESPSWMCRWKVASTTCSIGRPHGPAGGDDDHHANHRDDDHDHPAENVAIMTPRTSTHQEILNMVEHQHLQ